MTSHQQLEQLIDDRRAALARRSAPRPRTPRWYAGWRHRRSTGPTAGAADTVLRVSSVGPRLAGASTAEGSSGHWTTTLAHLVADHGLGANEAAIAHLVRAARQHPGLRLCTEILEDRALPDVVRERALGRLLTGLAGSTEGASASSDRAA